MKATSNKTKKTILVTGGAGFIGSYICYWKKGLIGALSVSTH